MEQELFSIGETANMLGLSIQTLRRWDANGKFKAFRPDPNGHRYYKKIDIDLFLNDIETLAEIWVNKEQGIEPNSEFYCTYSNIFKIKLDKMMADLKDISDLKTDISLITAITGEIGNNSFDHNLGQWPDIPGIFFAYDLKMKKIVLADRGQGVLKTLQRVKTNLKNDQDALEVAFTEIITGRAPERRGNGLKFVKQIILTNPIKFLFRSGNAEFKIEKENSQIHINETKNQFHGSLAIINF